jgi:hypothetical protein
MLPAQHAVRLGLRAATRNPELAFAKTIVDLGGTALSLLPALLAAAVAYTVAARSEAVLEAALGAVSALHAMRWSTLGAILCAAILSWTLAIAFWSGALPLLAADAELSRRPPPGNFFLLAGRGFSRVVAAGAAASGISLLVRIALLAVVTAVALACLLHPSVPRFAGFALLLSGAAVIAFLVDLLGNLWLVRAAALGDSATAALGRAASLLGRRLGPCALVALAFALFDLLVALVSGLAAGLVTAVATDPVDANEAVLSIPARVAVSVAFAAVFAWLEVGRKGALAALAADDEGLIETPLPPPTSRPPPSERVIDALPVAEEPVIDALPIAEEPVTDALPVAEEPVTDALPVAEEPVTDALPVAEEPVIDALPVQETDPKKRD